MTKEAKHCSDVRAPRGPSLPETTLQLPFGGYHIPTSRASLATDPTPLQANRESVRFLEAVRKQKSLSDTQKTWLSQPQEEVTCLQCHGPDWPFNRCDLRPKERCLLCSGWLHNTYRRGLPLSPSSKLHSVKKADPLH